MSASESTGRREAGKVCREGRTHFCFWRTKTKNVFLGSEKKTRAGDLNRLSWVVAQSARTPEFLLPAFLLIPVGSFGCHEWSGGGGEGEQEAHSLVRRTERENGLPPGSGC